MDKIITWNLQHGGGKRVTKIIDVLRQHTDATIFVLTEFRNNDNASKIQSALTDLGFIHQYKIEAGVRKNSVLIAAKENFAAQTFAELGDHSQRVIKISNKRFSLYGCYFPGQDDKKYVFDFLLKEIKNNPTERIIITGDINTGKHYLDQAEATFYHADYLDKIENENYFDAWRHIHKDKKEYTWFSRVGNGFRIDHFFVHNDLKEKVKSCDYIHDYREQKITDHSMMTLELLD
jgi:exonuclease III